MEENIKGVHVLLITPENEIILQQKTLDYKPNPGMISMFGGGVESGESPLDVLKRELFEELQLELNRYEVKTLGTYYKTRELDGVEYGVQVYIVKNVGSKNLPLHEGERIIVEKPENLLLNQKVTRITNLAIRDLINRGK